MTLVLPKLTSAHARSLEEEQRRLEELYSLDVLTSSSDARFAHYTELASGTLKAPMASIVLVGKDELKFKSVRGRSESNTPREKSFAEHAMDGQEILIVADTRDDPRFAQHPLVEGEAHVRAYIGAVLRGPSGQPLGAICVMDREPRQFTEDEQSFLLQLARMLEHEMQDRAALAERQERIKKHALFDGTTGLPHEAVFRSRVAKLIESRPSRKSVIALLRLENFEAIHSAIGKSGAAYVVSEAAARVKTALDQSCLMGQVREDTIAVAFDPADFSRPAAAVARLLECFTIPFELGDHAVLLSVSVGATLFPKDGGNAEQLIKRARTALHSMPTSDTSRYRFYDPQLSNEAARLFQIQSRLKGALDRDELSLAYQPIISLSDGKLAGAEALMRWSNADLGEISPAEFIPIAEESGLIGALGAWALRKACDQAAAWDGNDVSCPVISVNLSSYQLRDHRLLTEVGAMLRETSVDGSKLNLEITEGSLIENIDEAVKAMRRLRKLGVTISVDDFGKGFSSLAYLRQMPVQSLKIDRDFIMRLPRHREDMQLVRSIVAMGHALDLTVVAEGVETTAQLDALRAAGCDLAQGFVIAPPLPAGDLYARFLTTSRRHGTAVGAEEAQLPELHRSWPKTDR